MVIAALNCAEQESCADFGIGGTPTVRLFLPGSTRGERGIDLRSHAAGGAAGLAHQVLDQLSRAPQGSRLPPSFPMPKTFEPLTPFAVRDEVTRNHPKKTAFILDPDPSSSSNAAADSHSSSSSSAAAAVTPPGGLARLVALEMGPTEGKDVELVLSGVPPSNARAFRCVSLRCGRENKIIKMTSSNNDTSM